MVDKKMARLAEPEAAIASYLDDLLHTATSTALQEEQTEAQTSEPEKQQKTTVTEPLQAAPKVSRVRERKAERPVARPAATTEQKHTVAQPVAPKQSVVTERIADQASAQAPEPEKTKASGPPDWSEQPFECLIFTVAGLQLAVPLVLLGAIHRIEEEIRPIPGSPCWYMGIRPDPQRNVRVVDTAEWIMAGRVPAGARNNYRFIIRLDDSDWALACDDVAQSFTLKPDEVRWRTARSKRPWLAGTVINQMCALIDVRAMAQLLIRAEREHHLDMG